MANLFNYPQVVMSLYDVPMEASGALSLGTSAGVGSSFSTSTSFVYQCSGGSYSNVTRFLGSYADGDIIYWASCFNGINSYPISGGGFCDILCAYTASSPYNIICHITKSGNYFFAANGGNPANGSLVSFTADSNGNMTSVDDYRIGSTVTTMDFIYADTTLPLIYAASNRGIAVYCYNTSTGALGHTDYDYADVDQGNSVYSYIRSGCKIVVMSRLQTLAVWCMNTSTCMLGNYMCNSFTGGWFGLSASSCITGVWGGCSTGCHLSDGGYFLVASMWCGIGVVCTYNDSGTTKLCLETCASVHTHFCSGDYILNICGDNDYIYATGRCARIYKMSLNCSTGVLTCLDSYEYCDTTNPAFNPKLHTRQGYCLFLGESAGISAAKVIGKPAPHYSISGLYGGADNTNVALSHYYKGGSYVANNSSNTNVPTSGTIDFSDFYSQG